MSRIFISYSREDEGFARRLAAALSDAGADIWLDVNAIPAGMKWSTAIQQGLDECEVLLVVISPDSMASENVEDEWQYFKDEGKPIVPVLLREAKVHFQLRRLQYVDFLNNAFDAAFALLVTELQSKGLPLSAEQSESPSTGVASAAAPVSSSTPPDLSGILPPPFEWCYVPAGKVFLSSGGQGTSVAGYYIAKYPITTAQYQVFVAHNGYGEALWWDFSEDALAWHERHPEPITLEDGAGTLPQSRLTWYEAVAYTRWLSWRLKVPLGLPSLLQWYRAAYGPEQWRFPWGDEFDPHKANTDESKIGGLTPVTAYPDGASSFGVMDLVGNVWEWCLTEAKTGADDLTGSGSRILCGGSWFYEAERATNSSTMRPNRRGAYGFRIVYNPPAKG